MADLMVAAVAFLLIAGLSKPQDDYTRGLRDGMAVAGGCVFVIAVLGLIFGRPWW